MYLYVLLELCGFGTVYYCVRRCPRYHDETNLIGPGTERSNIGQVLLSRGRRDCQFETDGIVCFERERLSAVCWKNTRKTRQRGSDELLEQLSAQIRSCGVRVCHVFRSGSSNNICVCSTRSDGSDLGNNIIPSMS